MGSRQRRERREAREQPDNDGFVADWDTPEWRAKNVKTNRMLLSYFPELEQPYKRKVVDDDSEDDGPFVVYSLVFYPFVDQALRTEADNSPLLDRIFDFINMLAEHENEYYANLADVGIGEFLADDKALRRRAIPRLGPKMRAAIEAALT